jgi:hypothetical protein
MNAIRNADSTKTYVLGHSSKEIERNVAPDCILLGNSTAEAAVNKTLSVPAAFTLLASVPGSRAAT